MSPGPGGETTSVVGAANRARLSAEAYRAAWVYARLPFSGAFLPKCRDDFVLQSGLVLLGRSPTQTP